MALIDEEKYQVLLKAAKLHLREGKDPEWIESELQKECEDVLLRTVVLKDARNQHNAAMQKDGIQKIIIGVVLILAGFLVTILNFSDNRSFDYALFGFTSAGILFVLYGLYRMIG